MIGRLCQWGFAGAVFAGFAYGVSASSGYLPTVGPVPIRFRAVAPPVTNLMKMPLPAPESPAPVAPAPAVVAPAPAVQPVPVVQVAPKTNSVAVDTQPEPEPIYPNSQPRVSAQMLLKYFNHSTNGPGTGIIAPLDFAPPAAGTTPPSTATYTTDPK